MKQTTLEQLKKKYYEIYSMMLDTGTCSLGHGTWILKNGKKIEFLNCTALSQSNTPAWMTEKKLEKNFAKEGYELQHECGVMD